MKHESSPEGDADWLRDLTSPNNRLAWVRFYHWIRPRILSLAHQRGLRHVEAMEAVQETMVAFSRDIADGRYDPARGALTSWILRLAGWKITEQFRQRRPDDANGEDGCAEMVDERALCAVGAADESLLEQALNMLPTRVSNLEYEIFVELVIDRDDGHTVARRKGISRNAVYLHKRRALACLRELLRSESMDGAGI
jgi:DNA-directed RNA polymerase specialized sigma24 family protein